MRPLIPCLCCTYGRPILLGETIRCFLDQDYDNKEMVILNDQEGVNLRLKNCPPNIRIYNHPTRFKSLGQKRNHLNKLAKGEYICLCDDDDLLTPWRLTESWKKIRHSGYDIVKTSHFLFSNNNAKYKMLESGPGNCASQAVMTRAFIKRARYPVDKSVGEDRAFERQGKLWMSPTELPFVWHVYRWGLSIYHMSGVAEKESWKRSLTFKGHTAIKGDVLIRPKFERDYWDDIAKFLDSEDEELGMRWRKKIKKSLEST